MLKHELQYHVHQPRGVPAGEVHACICLTWNYCNDHHVINARFSPNLPLLFRRILPNPRSHLNLSKTHPKQWYRNIHEKNVKKMEAPTWEGTIFAVLAWEQTVYSHLPPTTRKWRRHWWVVFELPKCIPRFNKNYIVPVEPAFRHEQFDPFAFVNVCGCGWGSRFPTRHALCKSPPNLVSHSALFDRPTPAWHYSMPEPKRRWPPLRVVSTASAKWKLRFSKNYLLLSPERGLNIKNITQQFHLRHLLHFVQNYNLGNVWKCNTKKLG